MSSRGPKDAGGNAIEPVTPVRGRDDVASAVARSLRRRYAAERRFKLYGALAVAFSCIALITFLADIIGTGLPAFNQTMLRFEVTLDPRDIDPDGHRDPAVLSAADYRLPVHQALFELFPEVQSRSDRRALVAMISPGAVYKLRQMVMDNPALIGHRVRLTVPMSDDIDQLAKGHIRAGSPEAERRVSDQQVDWFERLKERGLIESSFNWTLFTAGDSRSPELAGIRAAFVGTLWTMALTFLMAFPMGVGAAIYLEEIAPRNKWSDLIEVNINNLAAVPSIVFGLLGLAVFINVFGLPRSAPLVGALVLTLMTLPIIIIASRAALKAVPPSIREGALAVGASRLQTVFHHVVPLAMPGMLTGSILGMAHAMGETAPLLMIGMVAFVVDVPGGPLDPSTVMPVQIYLWSDSPERAFIERASAAIMVLLVLLVLMNLIAVLIRKRFERKW